MSFETVFLVLFILATSLLLIYEIVFVLCFKDVTKNTENKKKMSVKGVVTEDVIVQPMPLGYTEPSIRKFEQCTTPVYELPENVPEAVPFENENCLVEPAKAENRKAPILVVTSPSLSL